MNLSTYTRNEAYRIRTIDNNYYLLGCDNCFKLNKIGVIIIKYISTDITVDELANAIENKFSEVDNKKVKEDILQYIDMLIKYGVINDE